MSQLSLGYLRVTLDATSWQTCGGLLELTLVLCSVHYWAMAESRGLCWTRARTEQVLARPGCTPAGVSSVAEEMALPSSSCWSSAVCLPDTLAADPPLAWETGPLLHPLALLHPLLCPWAQVLCYPWLCSQDWELSFCKSKMRFLFLNKKGKAS